MKKYKRAKDIDHACELEEKFSDTPYCRLQWKGTDACLDFHCECGAQLHFDSYFLYYISCAHCKAVYKLNMRIEAIRLDCEPDTNPIEAREEEFSG